MSRNVWLWSGVYGRPAAVRARQQGQGAAWSRSRASRWNLLDPIQTCFGRRGGPTWLRLLMCLEAHTVQIRGFRCSGGAVGARAWRRAVRGPRGGMGPAVGSCLTRIGDDERAQRSRPTLPHGHILGPPLARHCRPSKKTALSTLRHPMPPLPSQSAQGVQRLGIPRS